jgi:hypothetical protein
MLGPVGAARSRVTHAGGTAVRELPGWPPRWSGLDGRSRFVGFPQGEVGTLRAVTTDRERQAVVLAIEFAGDYATGVLPLPPRLVDRVARLLWRCSGMPLHAIGRLALDGR